jgi:hypothetical protein
MTHPLPRIAAFDAALADSLQHFSRNDHAAALAALERAHVLGQRDFTRHLRVHWRMLCLAWRTSDGHEWRGQLWRLALTPLGHLTGRLPTGNTGGANVNAFRPMPVPPALAALLADGDSDRPAR